MENIDPATGQPLPADAIQRVLFLSPSVHVYNIPPLTSNKGYVAATWTADNNKRQIPVSIRLRVIETAFPTPPTSTSKPGIDPEETVKTDILLEMTSTGELFAAAPYTTASVVEQVLDSSRFFAIRVQGEGGRKAVLGLGFEERSDAFDFSVALQEVRRTLGIELKPPTGLSGQKKTAKEEKRDFSLKEGETITVNIEGLGRGKGRRAERNTEVEGAFSLPPPPQSAGLSAFLPPPPSAQEVKAQKRLSQNMAAPPTQGAIEDMGFDDGEFGEFQ